MKHAAPVATAILLLLVVPTGTIGHHEPREDERIVQPYNLQVMTHVPVVAGYEPTPTPIHCAAGAPETVPFHRQGFDGAHGWSLHESPLARLAPNLWHVTAFEGIGEERAGDRLYFGHSSGTGAGSYEVAETHVAGTIRSPPIALPADEEIVLSFATKWQVEYLAGYDHLWVELLDAAGQTHLLCSSNGAGRLDPAGVGGKTLYSSCSPYHASPCPVWSSNQEEVPEPPVFPDLGAPTWETRSVSIPPALAGTRVQIQFTFDAADPAANILLGWMIDDVTLGPPA